VRNPTVEAIFTTADDAMQGLWGLHMYVNAAVVKCDRPVMLTMLPEQRFPVTHEWQRKYDREELVSEMDSVFEFVHCRNSVVALVAIFEAAVSRFNSTLSTLGHAPARDKYKQLLLWICELLETTKVGCSAAMLARLRETCGDLDHARRIRNCITHNNRSYEQFYFDDTINNGWVTPQHMKDAVRGVERKKRFSSSMPYLKFCCGHTSKCYIFSITRYSVLSSATPTITTMQSSKNQSSGIEF
jgi:hypothetical protein